jgi:hypothetical protein
MNRYVYCGNNPLRFVDPTGEGFWSKLAKGVGDWVQKHWKEVAIVALCIAVVVTAGALAPLAFAAIGVEVSATVSIASALVGGTVSAGVTYASSGGKATFSDIMKSFVIGGVTSAFLPGIARTPTALSGLGFFGSRSVAGGMGFLSGITGDLAGQSMGNIAGLATGSSSGFSFNPTEALGAGFLNAGLAVVPGGENFAQSILGRGGAGRYSSYLERGTMGSLLTPWKHSTSAFFYSATGFNTLLGETWEKMLKLPGWLP